MTGLFGLRKPTSELTVKEAKEVSEFPWTYESNETCYILEGKVTVIPNSGQPVQLGEGDLVTFPAGMSCTWQISSTIRKHYQLS